MNRKLKHGMSMAVAILSALFINTACTDDWDNHYDDNGTNAGKTSILDKIRGDEDLTNFCLVLDSMNIVDKKGNLVNFADSLFNQSRVYTLWAPVNEVFDPEPWLQMLQGEIDANGNMKKPGREKVFTRLVGSHVADYLKVASDTLKEDNFILLINQKMVSFVGGMDEDKTYTFDGLPITEKNIRVSNGIIHKIGGLISYSPNIWEYLDGAAEADSVKEFLYSFNKSEFNPYLSIEGPTVNGDKTYIDSVFTNSNQWLKLYGDKTTAGFGDISKEDSSYVVFVPSNKVWTEMVPKLETYFRIHTAKTNKISASEYERTKAANDSLCAFYARKALLNYIVFSNNDQPSPGVGNHTVQVRDSLLSTYTGGPRLLFAKSDLMDGVIDSAHLSNGTFYLKDNFNYNPFELWHDTIILEAENGYYQGITYENETPKDFAKNGSAKGVQTKFVSKDAIHYTIDSLNKKKNLIYVELEGLVKETSQQTLTWTIPEVLSGSYYVGAVVVPQHVASKDSMAYKSSLPNLLDLTLQANKGGDGANGKPARIIQVKGLSNDPTGIDTVWISEKGQRSKIKFACCEYGLPRDKQTVTLEVKNAVKRDDKNHDWDTIYDRKLRVDLIVLEPVENDEE